MLTPELNVELPQAPATERLGEALASALLQSGSDNEPNAQARATPPPPSLPSPSLPSPSPSPSAAPPSSSAAPSPSAPMPPGAVIHLRGELGTGKTACARSLLRALGVRGLIRSPTYTLVETYSIAIGGYTCVHVDLYRVSGAGAVEDLGLRDWVGADALVLIEWPERGGVAVPHADLTVLLSYSGSGRHARLLAHSAVGERLLHKLRVDASLAPYLSNFA